MILVPRKGGNADLEPAGKNSPAAKKATRDWQDGAHQGFKSNRYSIGKGWFCLPVCWRVCWRETFLAFSAGFLSELCGQKSLTAEHPEGSQRTRREPHPGLRVVSEYWLPHTLVREYNPAFWIPFVFLGVLRA